MSPDFHRPAGYVSRTIRDRIIVCCGIGSHYQRGYHSTLNHCDVYEPATWQLFSHDYPDGCPTQSESQYAFKIHAMQRAIDAGFRFVLWMDTAFQPIASIEPLWQHIEANGWFVPRQHAAVLGNWSTDEMLRLVSMSRGDAMRVPLCFSGIVGLDMASPIGKHIWDAWKTLFEMGAFMGPHQNEPGVPAHPWGQKIAGHCSDDPRCEGHRHDESALSVVLWDLGLIPRSEFLTMYNADGIIGHHVPDYDIPKMRETLLRLAGTLTCGPLPEISEEELEALCR